MRLLERLRVARAGTSPLTTFFVLGLFWLIVLTVAWSMFSSVATRPASQLAYIFLEHQYHWVDKVKIVGPDFQVETWLKVVVPNAPRGATALLVAETQPARYGFGLPLLLALFLASRSPHLIRNALLGALILLPFQAFGIVLDIIKQCAIGGGADVIAQMGLDRWQVEAVALGYQLGVLLLPALVPIMVWLFFERKFLGAVVIDGLMRRPVPDLPGPSASVHDVPLDPTHSASAPKGPAST